MAQNKAEIQGLLESAGTEPQHRFGQNFMIDQNLVRLVADSGQIQAGDLIIEVGPGTGTLTDELLARGADVVAVEIDRNLAEVLRQKFDRVERFRLIEGDALSGKHELNETLLQHIREATTLGRAVKLVANLPYNIASPLVIECLIAGVSLVAFTVQKEVADRFRAGAGGDAYGPLSVMAQLLGKVEILRTLPPQAFWPQPKIDSALVRIVRSDQLGESAAPAGAFIHGVFSYRRKTLRKAIVQAGYDPDRVLSVTGFDGRKRPEEFSPTEFMRMFCAVEHPIAPPTE